MLLAIDVYYFDNSAKTVGIIFHKKEEQVYQLIVEFLKAVEPYSSGQFYKRELPCVLKILENVDLNEIEMILIDGFVYLDNEKKLGLGGRLWEALNKKVPIVGIAKNPFKGNSDIVKEVRRGKSKKPLYISSVGIPIEEAVQFVMKMKGEYRIPNLLKELDKITKEKSLDKIL